MGQKSITFKKTAGEAQQAFVVAFDLQGFSTFFSQPDVQFYVAKYLNKVFEAMDIIINGGKTFWHPKKQLTIGGFKKPSHIKFVGDGAIYIWTFKANEEEKIREDFFNTCNHFWDFKNYFDSFLLSCKDEVPVVELPKKVRFGISSGSVYKLTYSASRENEYIGYCINLASRLQSYCRDIGFIVSGRVSIKNKELTEKNYKMIIAKKLKGLPSEYVFVDVKEYENLDLSIKEELFDEIKGE